MILHYFCLVSHQLSLIQGSRSLLFTKYLSTCFIVGCLRRRWWSRSICLLGKQVTKPCHISLLHFQTLAFASNLDNKDYCISLAPLLDLLLYATTRIQKQCLIIHHNLKWDNNYLYELKNNSPSRYMGLIEYFALFYYSTSFSFLFFPFLIV